MDEHAEDKRPAQDVEKQLHYACVLVAYEAGEITIGQTRMLLKLFDGEEIAHIDIRLMRNRIVKHIKDIWDQEFADRHNAEAGV